MQIKSTTYPSSELAKIKTDVLFVGLPINENGEVDRAGTWQDFDETLVNFLKKQQNEGRLPEKTGALASFYDVEGIGAKTVVVFPAKSDASGMEKSSRIIVDYLRAYQKTDAAVYLADNIEEESLMQMVIALRSADYQFEHYKSKPKKQLKISLTLVTRLWGDKAKPVIKNANAIADGMALTKDLGNSPSNVCTPRYLAKVAKNMAENFSDFLTVEVLKKKALEEMGMGALLSVAKGSIEPPRLIKFTYKNSDADPIVLVGKGVTFDSGGISLKPGASMDEMKYDMCGAATVFGVMRALAEMKAPLHVIGVVAAVENMPSGSASKPGDIVTSLSGKTIEILNTDAEGRLILCDALTYAQRFKPRAIIDIATLTGAVIIALGNTPTGLMSNDDALADALLAAGTQTHDRAWRLPLWPEYNEAIKSPFADLQNISGGREGGAIIAGAFLSEFIQKGVSWAHLDIAGTAWHSGKNKGATARPVPLLMNYLLSLS